MNAWMGNKGIKTDLRLSGKASEAQAGGRYMSLDKNRNRN